LTSSLFGWPAPRRPGGSRLGAAELAHTAGISIATLNRLVRAGVVPVEGDGEFTAATALRLRRMLRLHRDLGVGLLGAAIIVDLLDRLERFESAARAR
jgi:DNA-binding transcriptional MerR regulator